jgi:hypothetical protein
MAFVGTHKDAKECHHCKRPRHRPCFHSDCLSGRVKECRHKNRVAFKQVRYRSLLILLMYLLKQKGFVLALKYKHARLPDYNICDIRDGLTRTRLAFSATPVSGGEEYNRYFYNLEALCILQPPLILTCLNPLAADRGILDQYMVLLLRRPQHPLE